MQINTITVFALFTFKLGANVLTNHSCRMQNTRKGAKFAARFESARSLSNNSDRVAVRHSRPANSNVI